jgi:glycosyltransferase involved in cell wall biosynthesis
LKDFTILHVGKFYPPHNGGMETHLHDLAVRQAAVAEVSVIVANTLPRYEHSINDGVSVTRVARIATIASMPVCLGMSAAIRRSPADLVHIHMPNPGAAYAFLMSGHPGKLVLTHHADTLGRKVLRQLSDPFVARLMRRASRIIVTSNRYRDSSAELAPFKDKCKCIPLGIDCRNVSHTDTTTIQHLRQIHGDRIVVAIGRLVPYKGFDYLIRAMKFVEARLLLIGTGPQYDHLMKLALSEGVEKKVLMLGHVREVGPYLSAAKLLVLPSVTRAEAFGLVQLEAMAAGLPIVNTEIESGVPEVSVDGQTGITVPPRSETALANAIQLLMERDDLRMQFGNAARARVLAEYTADLMASRTLDVYTELLGTF